MSRAGAAPAARRIPVPVPFPVATQLGIDRRQLGTDITLCATIGAITPPVGLLPLVGCRLGAAPMSGVGWWI